MWIKREILINELNLPEDAIKQTLIDHSRWSLFYEIIFEYNNEFYKTTYSVGATEMQDESPWQDEEVVRCTPVEKRIVQVEKWVEKE